MPQQIAYRLKSLLDYSNDDMEEVYDLTFQITYKDVFGNVQTQNLKNNGNEIHVNKQNVQVRLYIQHASICAMTVLCRNMSMCIRIGYLTRALMLILKHSRWDLIWSYVIPAW